MQNETTSPDEDLIVSYLLDEMTPEEKNDFQRRIEADKELKSLFVRYQSVDSGLRKIEKQTSSEILTQRIMQDINKTIKPKKSYIPYIKAAGWAALLFVAFGKFFFTASEQPSQANTVAPKNNIPAVVSQNNKLEVAESGALEWLHQAQATNGSWVGQDWGADSQYTIGLTGLSLLAFVNAEHKANFAAYLKTVEKATQFILESQNADGSFGPSINNRLYNQGIATVALFKVNENYPNLVPIDSLKRAIDFISLSQNKSGGWGYSNDNGSSNTAISIWQIHSLILAKQYGFSGLEDSINANLAWVKGMTDKNGVMGYRKPSDYPFGQSGLVAMSGIFWLYEEQLSNNSIDEMFEFKLKFQEDLEKIAMAPEKNLNYYQFYFLTFSLKKLKEKHQFQLAQKVEDILIAKQIQNGPQLGSWEPNDAWGHTGGRVYSTAMATISLVALK